MPSSKRFSGVIAVGLLAGASILVGQQIGVDADALGPTAAPTAALDQYGGASVLSLPATGYFRVTQHDNRWWLVTPEGHPFYSAGLNHVDTVGTVDKNGNAAYAQTVATKYGSSGAWADAQVPRFGSWGINTLGGWSDVGLFNGRGVAYTVILNLAGQDFATGKMSDFWSPAWVSGVQSTTASVGTSHKDDPWLVGYFLDNELHWARDWRLWDQLDIYSQRDASSAGKSYLVGWLKARYGGDFAAFAADFSSVATDWASFEASTEITDSGPGAAATRAEWAGVVAERYFSVADAALKSADPNHLNLGARFLTQLTTPEVASAAARHVDVLSVNWYDVKPEWADALSKLGPVQIPVADTLRAWYDLTSKPMLVSEFGYRAMDSGLPNTWPPFQVVVDTQQTRAAKFVNYVDCAINTGYVVGTHWFEMVDEPAAGRFDGEDDNWGMVTEGDVEYPEVTAASATLLDHAYAPLTDPSSVPFPCEPVGPQPPPPSTTTTATPVPSTAASSSTSGTGGSTGGASRSAASAAVAVPRFTG